ncbi:MAG TPA: TolC family protein [Vicinamibacterales bacterium]|nr:TolC family protein [Vicinamibacterales bacterium]
MNLTSFFAGASKRRPLLAMRGTVFAWCLALTAHAAEGPLTLDAAIDRALSDAPQLASAQASLEGAQASLIGAGRLPDPEAIIGVDNLPLNGAEQFSVTRDFMTMRKVGLMQTVPAGAKRRVQSELASRELDVAQAELRATRFEIASAAAEAWIATSSTEQTLARFNALRRDLGLQSTVARTGLSSGRSSAVDALAGEAALARLESEILDLEQRQASQLAELRRWIGSNADRPLEDLPWKRELDVSAQVLSENVANHPPLAPFAARIEAARTQVDLAKAERRPDWSAELSFAKRGPDYSDMVSLEFRLGLPLFRKNRQNPLIASKLANVRAEEARQDAAVRMHTAEVESMVASWRLGRKRLEHFEATLLPLSRDRSRAVLSAYGSGRGEMWAVLDALRDELDLQREFVALEADVTRAWVFLHLLHSTGAMP